MAGTIDLPEVGRVKKVYVYAAVAIVGGIVVIAYVRKSRGSSAAAGTGVTAAPVDPQTGFPAGSAEDVQALDDLSSGSGFVDTSGGSIGPGVTSSAQLFYDPADGLYDLTSPYVPPTGTGGTGTTGASNTGPGTFTDNAYWTQYAIENVTGYTAAQIQGAIAAVMAGQGLTTTQLTIWQQCLAVAGSPPTAPSSAPHLATNGGGATGGNTSSHPAPSGISTTPGPNYIDVGISPVAGAPDLYHYQALTASGGLASDTIVAKTSARLTGLSGKTKYLIRVSADPNGLWSAERAVTTT